MIKNHRMAEKSFIFQKKWLVLIIILIIGFLRLYRLESFAVFLGDQGRDAIIIKRILTLEHLPTVGPPTSIGQVYLGPFYYYLIAPFLLIFNYNPLGLAFGVAFFSFIGIILSFLIVKKELGFKIGLFFLILISFSFVNIEYSRFSWNPNLLPFFSFFTLYFFFKLFKDKSKSQMVLTSLLAGGFLSFSIQLHYLALFLLFPIVWIYIRRLFQSFFSFKTKSFFIKKVLISIESFIFFSLPLLIFDLRHNFLNSKNFIKLFKEQNVVSSSSFFSRFLETNQAFINHSLNINLGRSISFVIFIFLIFTFFYLLKKKKSSLLLRLNLFNIIVYILAFSLLNSPRHAHYYGVIYLSFYLLLGCFFSYLWRKKIIYKAITIFIILFYIYINGQNYYFLTQKPNNQIEHAEKVANLLAEKIENKPFNIATWPVYFSEDSYLYFLELKGLRPVDRRRIEIAGQMFVLCNKNPCRVIDSPSWNISMFGRAKIDKIWQVEGIKIYKIVHEK